MVVLIVDDEAIIREGMRSLISWEEAGFRELLEAEDAREALAMIEERQPELIITDIFMPEMSGIEFAERVKDKYPSTHIIILTGYEKFEYARAAIRIGVAQYMVKPVFPEELAAVVHEITGAIEKRRKEESWKMDAAKRLDQYNPIIQEKFWRDLLTGTARNPQEIREQQALFDIRLDSQQAYCVIIQTRPEQEGISCAKADLQLLAYAVRNIAEEMFQDSHVYFAAGELSQLYAVFLEPVPEERLHHLHYNVEGLLKLKAFIGIGKPYPKLDQLSLSAREANEAVQLLLDTNESGVIRYDQMQDKKRSHVYYPYALEKSLLQKLRFGEHPHSAMLTPFVEALNEQAASLPVRKLVYVQLLSAIYRLADEYEMEEILGPFPPSYRQIERAEEEREILLLFQELFSRFAGGRNRAQAGYVERLVEEARGLIGRQYPNSLFSVGTLAEQLNVSAKYLSRIFRKITGQTCIEYLTQVRVEQAKEWLRSTNLRSLEIGEKVGYPNPHYFSLVFKKQTGMSPTEYRLSMGVAPS
jgi:YesN/AraC family two-component response regulator